MQAVILGAGRGIRMQNLNDNRPKPLITLLGETIIDRQLKSLRQTGVNNINVVIGYQASHWQSYAKQVNLILNPIWQQTNTAASLCVALNAIEDKGEVLIINGDMIFDSELIKRLLTNYPNESAAIVQYKSIGKEEISFITKDNWIINIGKQIDAGEGEAVGIYKLSGKDIKKYLDTFTQEDMVSYYEDIFRKANITLRPIDAEELIVKEIDTPEDYFEALKLTAILDKQSNASIPAIDFYLIDTMEIENYMPIIEALRRRQVDVTLIAEPPQNNPVGSWFDYQNALNYLHRHGISYSEKPNHDHIAITTQRADILSNYRSLKFRIMYGNSLFKESFCNTRTASVGFDGILVHGQYSYDMTKSWHPQLPVGIMGFPKYDRWLGGKLNLSEIKHRLGVPENRPIALYLPTWAEKSSIEKFAEAVGQLSSQYHLLIKPHHCTARLEPSRMEQLQKLSATTVSGNYPIDELYAIADLIIADMASGTLSEALLTDATIVTLDPSRIPLDQFTDVPISDIVSVCDTPQLLWSAVQTSISHHHPYYLPKREFWRERLFSFRDGYAAERAADVLCSFIRKTNSYTSPWRRIQSYFYQYRMRRKEMPILRQFDKFLAK